MGKTATKAAATQIERPKLGASVIVQVFPVGRDPMQIPLIQYFAAEPVAEVRSAVWLA